MSVTTDLPSDLPKVRGDRVQIEQVLLNLLTNACDAVADAESEDRRLLLQARLVEGARTVQVSVADRGRGIPAGETERVFEPFVTTKARGMGLGLAVCRTIVSAHGGRLWAANNPERGATFHFTLPISYESGP